MTAIIALATGITPCMMLIDGFSWFIAAVSVIIGAFFIDIMINTSYTIKDGKLILKAGILFGSTLDLSKIISIKSIHTIINENSYAWSADRLLITMPKGYKYMVSPTDKAGFIDALLSIHPDIPILDDHQGI